MGICLWSQNDVKSHGLEFSPLLPMRLASQLKRRTSSFAVAFAATVGSIALPVCSVNSSNSSNSEDSDMIGEGVPEQLCEYHSGNP
jgi:hypothetical protein